MMIPTIDPIVVPLPSLGHRRFCVASSARGHPDSGGATIMGVPLPHLVFFFLWTCRQSGVSSPYGGLVPMRLRCCGCIPAWCRPMALSCGHVGRRRAHSTMAMALCVVCAFPFGVGVDQRRACPHTVAMSGPGAQQGSMVSRPSRAQWFCDVVCVCGNRGRRTHNGYPRKPGRVGGRGCDAVAFLGVCVSLR